MLRASLNSVLQGFLSSVDGKQSRTQDKVHAYAENTVDFGRHGMGNTVACTNANRRSSPTWNAECLRDSFEKSGPFPK